jgi:hypothetical protein
MVALFARRTHRCSRTVALRIIWVNQVVAVAILLCPVVCPCFSCLCRRGGVTNIPPSNSHSQYLSVRPETQLAEQEAQARRAQGKVEQAAQAKDEVA